VLAGLKNNVASILNRIKADRSGEREVEHVITVFGVMTSTRYVQISS